MRSLQWQTEQEYRWYAELLTYEKNADRIEFNGNFVHQNYRKKRRHIYLRVIKKYSKYLR